jgi:hypothetical protein
MSVKPFHIPILIVPISPISNPVFDKYAKAISEISCVTLDIQVSSENKYSKQLFHPGNVYLDFMQDYRKDLQYLSDIALHYSIAAVIGVLHCKVSNLESANLKFQEIISKVLFIVFKEFSFQIYSRLVVLPLSLKIINWTIIMAS